MRRAPALVAALLLLAPGAVAAPPAFPGATGFGAAAVGGRGGDVYHVTNLDDDGPGSLRHGIASATGPRTVVFETSGLLDLASPLRIRASHLTIAGQTSPGGVTIRGYPVEVVDSEHVVIRYMRFRPGDIHAAGVGDRPGNGNADLPGAAADALNVLSSDHVIVDHVSASWSMDETLSVTKSTNVTVSWSIISESLWRSFHPEGEHGRGSLVRGEGERGYTFHRNLWAHHNRRSPGLGGQQDDPPPGEPGLGLDVDLIGNVVYDWQLLPSHTLEDPRRLRIHMIGNAYVQRSQALCPCMIMNLEGSADEVFVYRSGNVVDHDRDGIFRPVRAGDSDFFGPYTFVSEPFPFERRQPRITRAVRAYKEVLKRAGASHVRDSVDERVVHQVRTQTGGLIDSQDEVGGWGEPPEPRGPVPEDLDRDGMADAWEGAKGLDPTDPEDRNGVRHPKGFTNLEVYLDQRTR